ncbi:MAG: glycoside hydrolase family 2 TIM barrel-domain containing protein [Eubacteriales bacterium]
MRETIRLSDGWLFHAGAENYQTPRHKSILYASAKTESRRCGFASLSYNDDQSSSPDTWETVRIPHDYAVAQRPSPAFAGTLGSVPYGEAWYRRALRFPDSDRGRRLLLCFEAVATYCEIYFNGCLLMKNDSAYTPFEVDISDFARFGGEKNVLAVRILPTVEHEGWWYTGAGITRAVTLLKTDPSAIGVRGVWVRPVREDGGVWRCEIETTLVRGAAGTDTVFLTQTIGGRTVTGSAALPPYGETVVRQVLRVEEPRLWDVDDPQLYTCESVLFRGGEPIDAAETTFGFRTAEFGADGFYLNGRRVPLHGVCCHEDYGITGRAVPDSIRRYRVQLLREMGANAYRCSHYPQSEGTMDALDRAGMLVMAETRHFSSAPSAMAQLETLVRRDRNHPSVILYSIGNEEWYFEREQGAAIARRMIAAVRRLDPDRAVTAAVDKSVAASPVMDEVDVLGVNYNTNAIDALHARLPGKPVLWTECMAAGTTRGYYAESDAGLGRVSGYDCKTNGFGDSARATQRFMDERPFMAGGFRWTGLEYRGESEWPRLASQSGAVDLFLQKKDAFYQLRALWTDEPTVHILPHWNHAGREGEEIAVQVYTNCAQISLSLNGIPLGRCRADRYTPARFAVPYAAGVLRAVGYGADGAELAADEVRTSGVPVRLRLRIDNAPPALACSDVAHVTAYTVDADGNFVPDASARLTFTIEGAQEVDYGAEGVRPVILGTGSSVTDPEPPASRSRVMYAGLASCAVRLGDGKYPARLCVSAPGLGEASVRL